MSFVLKSFSLQYTSLVFLRNFYPSLDQQPHPYYIFSSLFDPPEQRKKQFSIRERCFREIITSISVITFLPSSSIFLISASEINFSLGGTYGAFSSLSISLSYLSNINYTYTVNSCNYYPIKVIKPWIRF